ncbi:uncharacterized protein LOC143914186 [Arctopsyche grandis]|uniref:uncharacterized protein LOC143914186 n=1 Tax=Arctopsyche grandis TaxID=121162 RepID=UPI00406DA476
MENNDAGESSCKKHSHNDNTSSSRPLKKAKFPWQVKGKYHLKDQDEAMDEDPVQPEETTAVPSVKTESAEPDNSNPVENKFDNKVEENLEMLGDYLLKQDFSSLNTLLFGPETEENAKKATENSTSSDQSASTTYPKYTPSYNNVPNSNNNNGSISPITIEISDSSSDVDTNIQPANPIKQRVPREDDQTLRRWQARQIAKGYVDNTINRVLDSWFVAPLPPNVEENRRLGLDVTGLLDDLSGDDGIENEGILMAISAHGLQNNRATARTRENITPRTRNLSTSNENLFSPPRSFRFEPCYQERSRLLELTDALERSTSDPTNPQPWSIHEESCDCALDDNRLPYGLLPYRRRRILENAARSTANPTPTVDEPMVSSSETKKEPEESPSPSQSNDSSSGSSNNNENTSMSNSAQNDFSIPNNTNGEQFEEHFDFLDAAVSYAIQAKGLIPF